MHKAAVAAALVWALIQTPGQALDLADLTVPVAVLPRGCALSPAPSERIDGNRSLSGLWAGLPIPVNPWIGADAPIVASIVERLQPASLVPDGPPQARNEAARFRLHFADGVEQAYAAIYGTGGAGELAAVYAIKFTNAEAARAFAGRVPPAAAAVTLTGRVAVATSGGPTDCLRAIRGYLGQTLR